MGLHCALGEIASTGAPVRPSMFADTEVRIMNELRKSLARAVTVGAMALAVGIGPVAASTLLRPGAALAASQPLVPDRCFAQVGVHHVVLGPIRSFCLIRFRAPPASKKTLVRRP